MNDEKTKFLERIYDKQERMSEDIADIKIVLAKQEENLRQHMYRTELAEESIDLLRKQLKHIDNHVTMVNGGIKVLGGLAFFAGFVFSVLKIIEFFQ